MYTDSPNDFGMLVSQKIFNIILNILDKDDRCYIAISGGSTPEPVFSAMVKKSYQQKLDWFRVHVFFVDERCVPSDHKENNFKSCYDLWLQYYPEVKCHRIQGWLNPAEAAKKYEIEMEIVLKKNGFPCFDLIFMGIGDDGHIASLFPEYDFNKSVESSMEDVYVESKKTNRVTMTLPTLNNAKNRIIGIVGKDKKKIFNDLTNSQFQNYPVANLLSSKANDTWVLY